MTTIFTEPDFNTIQLLYGFVLTALAILATTALLGNVFLMSGIIALLLLKDGIPNLIIGALKIGQKPDKVLK